MHEKGKLPEGWEVVNLGNLVTITGGGTPRTSVSKYWNGEILWCTPTDITKNKSKYIKSTEKTITSDGLSESAAMLLPEGTILLCSRATIGEMCIAAKQISTNQGFKNLVCNDNISNEFLFYVLSTKKQNMLELAIGSTFLEISKNALSSIKLMIPIEKQEQHAIAEVLSDMDGYIDSLEKLIAKKKAIKQGAMQELLTGKRRLPGFTGEWGEQILFCISENITMGQSPSSKYYNSEGNGLPLIQGNADIDNRKTIIRIYTSQITKEAVKGDIILTVRAPVGKVAKATFNCCLGRGVCAISSNNDYLYHWFIYFEPKWNSLSSGSTFDSINGEALRKITLNIPSDEAEQSAIAAVLSDMDAEIEALAAKLDKAKLIKQGTMQELLTGKIRLVNVSPIQKEFTISEYMIILAIITRLFTDNGMKFLKHMRYQKLVYLYLVYQKATTRIFEKWDYGPFSKELAYTVVPKAENEKSYIATDNDKNICVGENINEAVENAINKGYYKDAEQLAGRIRYKKDTELEVLATVVESVKDLEISQKAVSLQSVKEYIGSIPVWKHKLGLEYFTDLAIDKSIKEYYDFFK
jgi:type I restriction enzyme S subunit